MAADRPLARLHVADDGVEISSIRSVAAASPGSSSAISNGAVGDEEESLCAHESRG